MQESSYRPNKGDNLDVKILFRIGRDGIAKKNGFILFIANAKEGEVLKVRVKEVLNQMGIAEKIEGELGQLPLPDPSEPIIKQNNKTSMPGTQDNISHTQKLMEQASMLKAPSQEQPMNPLVEEEPFETDNVPYEQGIESPHVNIQKIQNNQQPQTNLLKERPADNNHDNIPIPPQANTGIQKEIPCPEPPINNPLQPPPAINNSIPDSAQPGQIIEKRIPSPDKELPPAPQIQNLKKTEEEEDDDELPPLPPLP